MELHSLTQIKKEMETYHPTELQHLLLRLVKYKKENKELLNYLLYEADDEKQYIKNVQQEMDEMFAELRKTPSGLVHKRVMKVVRLMQKYIKFSGDKRTETEIRIHLCALLCKLPSSHYRRLSMEKLLLRQTALTRACIATLHEDLQFDYTEILNGVLRK